MLLKNYLYNFIIKHDIINKFNYRNVKELPEINKINLNFGCTNKNINLKSIALAMLSIELITGQNGKLTQLKNATKMTIKIRKGYPVGCKATLRKTAMYEFFLKLLTDILPKVKNFYGIKTKKNLFNNLSFKLLNVSSFPELEKNHNLFKTLPNLDITFIIKTNNNPNEIFFLLTSHKLPLV